jgi:hypothetical protein
MKCVRPVLLAAFSLLVSVPGISLAASQPRLSHRTLSDVQAGASAIDVSQFRLPDSAFKPALINPLMDGRLSNVDVNVPSLNPLLADHITRYAGDPLGRDLHRLDGYREQATWGGLVLTYEASVFTNSGWALNALRDGIHGTSEMSSATGVMAPEGCGPQIHHPCDVVTYVLGSESEVYSAVQYNQCLVETRAQGAATDSAGAKAIMMKVAANVLKAGDTLIGGVCALSDSATPSATDFNVIVARVEAAGSAPDFQLRHEGLRQIRVGHPVTLALYFSVTSMPGASHAFADFTVKRGSAVEFFHRTRAMAISSAPDSYRLTATFTPHHTGHEVIVGRVHMDGIEHSWTTAVSVTK